MCFHALSQTAAKKRTWPLSSKKSSATLTVVGWNDNRAVYIASSESSESKRFVRRWNKAAQKYNQEQQPN